MSASLKRRVKRLSGGMESDEVVSHATFDSAWTFPQQLLASTSTTSPAARFTVPKYSAAEPPPSTPESWVVRVSFVCPFASRTLSVARTSVVHTVPFSTKTAQ